MQKVVTIERISTKNSMNLVVKEKDTGKLYDIPASAIVSYELEDGNHLKVVDTNHLKVENEIK
jgi:hypothetical protein